jgi:hypothetical protein
MRRISLGHCVVTTATVRAILASCVQLEHLELVGIPSNLVVVMPFQQLGAADFAQHASLTELRLDKCTFLRQLDVSDLPSLAVLEVSDCLSLREVRAQHCPMLADLSLINCPVAKLVVSSTSLCSLDVGSISAVLAELDLRCPLISNLDLSGCAALTAAGIAPLLQREALPRLASLNLTGCTRLGPAEIDALVRTYAPVSPVVCPAPTPGIDPAHYAEIQQRVRLQNEILMPASGLVTLVLAKLAIRELRLTSSSLTTLTLAELPNLEHLTFS